MKEPNHQVLYTKQQQQMVIKITERVIAQVCAAGQSASPSRRPTYRPAAAGRQDKLGQGEVPRGTRYGERQWESA